MTHLRQILLEELRRRNFADSTIRSYLHAVEHYSRYFQRRPDQRQRLSSNTLVSTQAMPGQSKSPEPAMNNLPWLQPCHTAAEKRGPPTEIKLASHRLWHI